jgi:hypothetical protein
MLARASGAMPLMAQIAKPYLGREAYRLLLQCRIVMSQFSH